MIFDVPSDLAERLMKLADLLPLQGSLRKMDCQRAVAVEVFKEGLRHLEEIVGAQQTYTQGDVL